MGGYAGVVKAAAVFINGVMAIATKGDAATTPLKAAVPYILTTEGSFSRDAKNGSGTYHFANGDRYEGQWRDDAMNGQCTFFYANDNRFEGAFRQNQIHGQGTYYFYNGDRYVGPWL